MPLPVPFRYHIDLFWSDEDECYIANLPDLRYCSAFGDSPEEAVRELMVAAEAWLEACEEMKDSVPEAIYRSSGSTLPS
jgi:predicted RNase H-like HicB family nuclease